MVQTKIREVGWELEERRLTLDVEHHAVRDLVISVRHNTCKLLLVGLAAWDHHVVAPYGHRSVLVASLLESRFTLQPGVPFDHTWGLPIG